MKSSLFYDIGSKGVQHFFELFVLCMDIQVDRLGQIQTENTHDGFCVNDITAGDEIEIKIETVNIIYKSLDFIDLIQLDKDFDLEFVNEIIPLSMHPNAKNFFERN